MDYSDSVRINQDGQTTLVSGQLAAWYQDKPAVANKIRNIAQASAQEQPGFATHELRLPNGVQVILASFHWDRKLHLKFLEENYPPGLPAAEIRRQLDCLAEIIDQSQESRPQEVVTMLRRAHDVQSRILDHAAGSWSTPPTQKPRPEE